MAQSHRSIAAGYRLEAYATLGYRLEAYATLRYRLEAHATLGDRLEAYATLRYRLEAHATWETGWKPTLLCSFIPPQPSRGISGKACPAMCQ